MRRAGSAAGGGCIFRPPHMREAEHAGGVPVNRPTTNQGPCSSASFLGLPGQRGKSQVVGLGRAGGKPREAGRASSRVQHGPCAGGAERRATPDPWQRAFGPPRNMLMLPFSRLPHHFMNFTSGSSLERHDCTTSPVTWRSGHSRRSRRGGRRVGTGAGRQACRSWLPWQTAGERAWPAHQAYHHNPSLARPLLTPAHHERADGAPPATQQRVQD